MRALVGLLAAACLCLLVALVCVLGLYRHDLRMVERNRSLEGGVREYIMASDSLASMLRRAEGRVNWLTHACAP